MRWYKRKPGTFEVDTAGLNIAEYGAYNRLVDNYYIQEKPLRDDDSWLAGVCRCPLDTWLQIKPRVMAFFVFNPAEPGSNRLGFWVHEKCERVMEEAVKSGDVSRENGRLGGRPAGSGRKQNQGDKPSNNPAGTQTEPAPNLTEQNRQVKTPPGGGDAAEVDNSRRGTRLPTGWAPSAGDLEYASSRSIVGEAQAALVADFCLYWTKGAGRNKTHMDWSLAFKSWVRRVALSQGRRPAWRKGEPVKVAATADQHGAAEAAAGSWGGKE